MVKPAMPYLDILSDASQLAPAHPVACYQVSGEFAMIVAGANAGVYDLRTMAFESVQSCLRAGSFAATGTPSTKLTCYFLRCYADLDIFYA